MKSEELKEIIFKKVDVCFKIESITHDEEGFLSVLWFKFDFFDEITFFIEENDLFLLKENNENGKEIIFLNQFPSHSNSSVNTNRKTISVSFSRNKDLRFNFNEKDLNYFLNLTVSVYRK